MPKNSYMKHLLAGCAVVIVLTTGALAKDFNIPSGDLKAALSSYSAQTGVPLLVSDDAIKGVQTKGVKGNLTADDALERILTGTGFIVQHHSGGAIAVVRDDRAGNELPMVHEAAASAPNVSGAALETVTVTSSKIGGDVQNIPIAITAMSQEQLTTRQVAGGPDLVKEVPNLTFSKTNFTGYNIQIRGIGTQAISVTTDPAVAVALNDIPFIRNHFFEQEFYDLSQAEVLRGPQGTLYGRNATAGVVNVVSAKPTDQFEAMLSADIGNYNNRRFEGMINVPVLDDRVDVRIAGEWTKRDGYSFNETTNAPIDGRDLWSSRATIGWKPSEKLKAYLVWEHFQEGDDRIRSGKQLCKTDPGLAAIDGIPVGAIDGSVPSYGNEFSQGCAPVSLYSPEAYQVPDGFSLPYIAGAGFTGFFDNTKDVYASTAQSPNLRTIQSTLNPTYKANNDIIELNADYGVTPALTFSSQTGFNQDFLYSAEDYNRFNAAPGVFIPSGFNPNTTFAPHGQVSDQGIFCDPQLGCTDRVVGEDLSDEHAWQLSQEVRLASNFSGPFNFSVGGNYLHYETEENYYVFINALTMLSTIYLEHGRPPYVSGVTDNSDCLSGLYTASNTEVLGCTYIDPNPIGSINSEGHNYFLSQNPYVLNSYAGFGEVYYSIRDDLKLTGGLRWTNDRKHFVSIPSELLVPGWGYPITGAVDQQWSELTGRFNATWTPKLDFSDQTLLYGSYAHGYKAGGANPPGAVLLHNELAAEGAITNPTHPLTFKPEFIDAFEAGTKNTFLDGALTVNGTAFYYDYKAYQISYIVDRTSVNLNFDAKVDGGELEATWEPTPGLRFNFAGGYEHSSIDKGQSAIDLMDRTAGHPGWLLIKPAITQASNCIVPDYVAAFGLQAATGVGYVTCGLAYNAHLDPITELPFVQDPTVKCFNISGSTGECNAFEPISGYAGFDPVSPTATNNGAGPAPNNGEGFAKDLAGNDLPNAPHFTTSLSAEYTLPISPDWAATLHSDFYWQSDSWARVWNDNPYDRIRGYTTTNLALILTNQDGWQVMGYLKNVFNVTAITGDFLNSDDSGLTTNVFLTDPRLFGVRATKNF